jgi:hypothetical protein
MNHLRIKSGFSKSRLIVSNQVPNRVIFVNNFARQSGGIAPNHYHFGINSVFRGPKPLQFEFIWVPGAFLNWPRLAGVGFPGLLCGWMKRLSLTILAAGLALAAAAQDDGALFGGATTQTRLLLAADAAKPGDEVLAGVELKMAPGWHTYWRNGGDAGIPTTVKWTLPPGVSAGEIHWPIPEKSVTPAGDTPLYTYGYEGTVVLLVPIKLAADLRPGPVQLSAEVGWMECKDTCNRYTARGERQPDRGERGQTFKQTPLCSESWLARLPGNQRRRAAGHGAMGKRFTEKPARHY